MDSLITSKRSDTDNLSSEMTNEITTTKQIPKIDRSSPDGKEKETDQLANCKTDSNDSNFEKQILKLKEQLLESEKVRSFDQKRLHNEKKDNLERIK